MSKYVPGIMGNKSTISKRIPSLMEHHSDLYGTAKVKHKEHKPTGKALALSNKLKGK